MYLVDRYAFNYLYIFKGCICTSQYNVWLPTSNGVTKHRADAYCYNWNPIYDPGIYCYLEGGLAAVNCPGARKSKNGEFYWTEHPSVCRASTELSKLESYI